MSADICIMNLNNTVRYRYSCPFMFSVIIKIYANKNHSRYFEDYNNIYIIMELCEGGELFDRIIDTGIFAEQDALNIFT